MSSTLPANNESIPSFSPIDMYTFKMSDLAGIRVYSDTRPHKWKIANLQKGLVLLCDGTEMVGEGSGFGFPVLLCSDETYFSGTSKTSLSQRGNSWIIQKEFVMDRTVRNRFRNVNLENRKVRGFFGYLSNIYQTNPRFRFLALKKLTGKMNISTTFVDSLSLGRVIVTYAMDKNHIRVRADFRHLETDGIQRIFILNEQGSRFFRTYADSDEIRLNDERIGAWDKIDASWASLIAPQSGLGFRLWKLQNCVLRRGREFLENSLDWVGLDYEVSPKTAVLEYVIEILEYD